MRFHNRIHRAGFFAKAAENAFGQIDIVAGGAAGAVFSLLRLDIDGQGRAHRFAQFAGNAALFAVGIPALRMQAAETHRLRCFLFGKHNGFFARKEVFERNAHAFYQFTQQKGFY